MVRARTSRVRSMFRHQRVLIDGLGVGLRVRHVMLRFLYSPQLPRPFGMKRFIVSGPPQPLHHLAAWQALPASRTAARAG